MEKHPFTYLEDLQGHVDKALALNAIIQFNSIQLSIYTTYYMEMEYNNDIISLYINRLIKGGLSNYAD